jgi:hypothetical protein
LCPAGKREARRQEQDSGAENDLLRQTSPYVFPAETLPSELTPQLRGLPKAASEDAAF